MGVKVADYIFARLAEVGLRQAFLVTVSAGVCRW